MRSRQHFDLIVFPLFSPTQAGSNKKALMKQFTKASKYYMLRSTERRLFETSLT